MSSPNFGSPTKDEWRRLYKAAIEFKELRPWEWTADDDLFSIKNPSNNEIGYCCVVGKIGLCFGLIVYLGTKGLASYLEMQQGLIDEKDMDAQLSNRCLATTFESRRYLSNKDVAVIEELGLAFKGKNAWPLFRSYYPGYHPWYLTDEEAKFMHICLEQAREVVLRFKEDPSILTPIKGNLVFARVPEKEGNKIIWKDEWLEPVPYREVVTIRKDMDRERLRKIEKTARRTDMIWESDFFYAPARIGEKHERPYYPIVILWTDRDSYFILNTHITAQDNYINELPEQFLIAIERNKIIPAEIWVKKSELHSYIEPLAQCFGIKLRIKKKLKSIDEARKSMLEVFTKRR